LKLKQCFNVTILPSDPVGREQQIGSSYLVDASSFRDRNAKKSPIKVIIHPGPADPAAHARTNRSGHVT
jgi:hypothetical protein